ncbi:hypothetical protein ACFSQU_14285 [Massilia sp. GCM10020059]|uniref:DUF4398 domain-containing protein n=1 Tax=Massilia agrisoli TaxID=2892444 RepID=A0ABS8IWK8_9BURK|nr:hypothetical protein [Massilia agrisoli]MCC6072929.1 hypothetical protein [Massilia agrisoli]
MKLKSKLVRAAALSAMVGLMSLQAGCGTEVGAQIASAILPADVHDVTASVNRKISEGKFKEAQDEGMDYLQDHEDKSGQLAWALARASARLSNHQLAVKFAGQAYNAGAVSTVQLMSEPMLAPVRTELRITLLHPGVDAADAAGALP